MLQDHFHAVENLRIREPEKHTFEGCLFCIPPRETKTFSVSSFFHLPFKNQLNKFIISGLPGYWTLKKKKKINAATETLQIKVKIAWNWKIPLWKFYIYVLKLNKK